MAALSTLFPVFFMVLLGLYQELRDLLHQNKKKEPTILSLMFCFQS